MQQNCQVFKQKIKLLRQKLSLGNLEICEIRAHGTILIKSKFTNY